MELKDLKRLLEAVAATDVSEFTLETGDYKLSLKRGLRSEGSAVPASAQPPASTPTPVQTPVVAALSVGSEDSVMPGRALSEVTAPIVGTFYHSPTPDALPYVKVGDRVETGQVLCIIEAMKLMNEIEAEVAGVVAEVLVRNEEPVEYGQVLFRIEPA